MGIAGSLNTQVTVHHKIITQDPTYGTEIVTWTPLETEGSPPVAVRFWASVEDVRPSRNTHVVQGIVMTRHQTRIMMRWRDDITSGMRMTVHGDSDSTYQIVGGPAEVGRKHMIEFLCEILPSGTT